MSKEHVSFRIDPAVVERMRNAVAHNRGAPLFLTLDDFAEQALSVGTAKLEREHNKGKSYGKPQKRATV